MPSRHELVAYNRTADEVCREIGADRLIYQELDDLIESVRYCNPQITEFDTSCFNGSYITGDVTTQYLANVDLQRSDHVKQTSENELDLSEVTDIREKRF